MNKAVLISIQPKWCELIASGKKTVEVRKSKPTVEMPFKCYIYCTKKTRKDDLGDYVLYEDEKGFIEENGVRFSPFRASKVIGEFICDKIDDYIYETEWDICVDIDDDTLPFTMLTREEINEYAHGKTLYGWHISELKIYDKPKELSEFLKPCKWRVDHGWIDYECEARSHKVGCQYAIEDRNPDGSVNDYNCGYKDYVTRPPQSWMYVEAPLMHYDEV